MLAIEVNFLTGRFVATAHNDYQACEWPPHPARLFSALVAGWAGAGEDESEREVLEWLENLPAPSLVASEANPRRVVNYYVPVNDAEIIQRRKDTLKNLSDLAHLNAQYEEELEHSGGQVTEKAERVYAKMTKLRDVAEQVSKPGTTSEESALKLLPDGRVKQERHFPSVTPVEPQVTYVWSDADISEVDKSSLDCLLKKVTRLGHSSSLVSCRMVGDPALPNWFPGSGSHFFRCFGSGQLEALRKGFKQHQAIKPRSLPFRAVRYSEATPTPDSSTPLHPDTSGDWIVFEFLHRSRRFPSTRVVEIASAMRSAIMSYAEDSIPEGLSGHQPGGAPTLEPHVAFLPLPYVGFEHADGRIMGLAISLPESLDENSRLATLRAIGHWEAAAVSGKPLTLTFGSSGTLQLQRRTGPSDLTSLRTRLWQKPSPSWVSATPIALPTHPGPLGKGSAAARAKAWKRAKEAVVASCRHVGLPKPIQVEVSLDPLVLGARPAADFPPFRQRGGDGKPVARRLVHAALEFDQPVEGPLVLGAGRFLGLGLMRPIEVRCAGDIDGGTHG